MRIFLYLLSALLAICLASYVRVIGELQAYIAFGLFLIFCNLSEDLIAKLNNPS